MKEFNFWLASFTMGGLGAIDNCMTTYTTLLLGFEFDSKIVPFCTKNFVENITVFLVLSSLAIWPLTTITHYRTYYAF